MKLPKQLSVFDFASKELSFSQNLRIKELPEINKIANNKAGKLEVSLSFFLENDNIPCVKGTISTKIALLCQRCLKNVFLDLNIEFNLAFIKNNSTNINLSPIFELYFIEKDNIPTIDIISEEILLEIPISPIHKYNCYKYKQLNSITEKNTNKPFAILKNIKKFK